jgi:protein-L-isoaspartate(D-aspartate) O-methyltransferase
MRHRIINDRESVVTRAAVPRREPLLADDRAGVRRPRIDVTFSNDIMDFEQARFNMVEQQIRTWEVLDQDVLDLLFTVRREDFVPPAHRSLAFADLELPIGGGERMWAPKLEARVLQSLRLQPQESVLEIGTGSGYFTALLASKAREVTTVEIDPALAASAAARLARHGFGHVRREVGDGARGYGSGLYDVIVLTGSTPLLPERLVSQLRPNGRLFAIVGEAPVMTARLVAWTAPGSRVTTDLFETVVAPLRNAATPDRFKF